MAAKKIALADNRDALMRHAERDLLVLMRAKQQHIVSLLGVVRDDPTSLTILMELAPKGSLRNVLDDAASRRAITTSPVLQHAIARGIVSGMAWCHAQTPRPVLHHDLKSANVLLFEGPSGALVPKARSAGTSSSSSRLQLSPSRLATRQYHDFVSWCATRVNAFRLRTSGWRLARIRLCWGRQNWPATVRVARSLTRLRRPTITCTTPRVRCIPLASSCGS